MPESIQDPHLAARLTEIDRRLREIQVELRPGEEVEDPPVPEPGAPRAPEAAPPLDFARPQHEFAPPPDEPEPHPTGGREGPLADLLQRIPRQQRLAGEELLRRFEQLTAVQADVAASLRELLDGFDRALGQLAGAATDEVTVSAGPFTTIGDVHAFVAELARMPGVEDAAVRGFEGADHAVVEVRLHRPNPYP